MGEEGGWKDGMRVSSDSTSHWCGFGGGVGMDSLCGPDIGWRVGARATVGMRATHRGVAPSGRGVAGVDVEDDGDVTTNSLRQLGWHVSKFLAQAKVPTRRSEKYTPGTRTSTYRPDSMMDTTRCFA